MNTHLKKMIAPVIVVLLLCCYYLFIGFVLIHLPGNRLIKITAGVFSLVLSVLLLYVLIERIREIRRGEEDDLSKY